MQINYLKGDATKPQGDGPKYIVHVCNDIGAWGRGFVLALSRRWTLPERSYRNSFRRRAIPILGEIQLVPVEDDITVVNMIAQRGIRPSKGGPPIRYPALEGCLGKVAKHIKESGKPISVHMPRIGAGLAGGDWEKIEQIIKDQLVSQGIEVTVYDLPR